MEHVTAAGLSCTEPECACAAIYSGPLAVGARACDDCKHGLRAHRIVTHGAYAADPYTGRMAEDFEIAPAFR